jgi:hypothetical protein
MKARRSALVLQLPTKVWLDFYIREEHSLEMEFGDEPRGLWGWGHVNIEAGEKALTAMLESEDIRETMNAVGAQLEYYEDPFG